MLDADVVGCEASPALYSLLEEGMDRLRRAGGREASAAARVHPRWADVGSALRHVSPGSVDVVYFDPMFQQPKRAMPGWDLLRRVADHGDPAENEVLERALHAARLRVVLKVRRAAEVAGEWTGRVRGKEMDYLVRERQPA
jgi:hypothetical protein